MLYDAYNANVACLSNTPMGLYKASFFKESIHYKPPYDVVLSLKSLARVASTLLLVQVSDIMLCRIFRGTQEQSKFKGLSAVLLRLSTEPRKRRHYYILFPAWRNYETTSKSGRA